MDDWRLNAKHIKWWNKEDSLYNSNRWTSFSDIGKVYFGSVLTEKEYTKVESKYIDLAKNILDITDSDYYIARGIEIYNLDMKYEHNVESHNLYTTINEEDTTAIIKKSSLDYFMKLLLREHVWCILETPHKEFQVRFGYDYYIYVIGDTKIIESCVEESGLFV